MSRIRFDCDKLDLNQGFTALWHGGRSAGKTHALGDMLRYESKEGPVWFLNFGGEDGQLTLKGMGLGNVGETLETYSDCIEWCNEQEAKNVKLQALAGDSLAPLSRRVMISVVGDESRLPKVIKASGGSEGKNEWGEYHLRMENLIARFKRLAKYVAFVCPSDKSIDQLNNVTYITPDLPGRQAVGSGGWFDFVGYIQVDMEVTAQGNRPSRTMIMVPNGAITVRQRLPEPGLLENIKMLHGPGSWERIKRTLVWVSDNPGKPLPPELSNKGGK